MCARKFGATWCRVGNARKIMVHRYAHLNLVLHGVKLVKLVNIIVHECAH